jgi:ABC-type transport system involved in multi-copper enzyme maturation permease subunit
MSKLGAIVRYEVLMAWRRRSLPILALLLFVGLVGFSLLVANNPRQREMMASFAASGQLYVINTLLLINVLVAGMIAYSVGAALMTSETIPLDRQFKVRELLDTLPISRATYLGGKLLGVWSGLLLGWGVMGVIAAGALYLIFGAYDLRVFALLWLLLPLPAGLVAGALSTLAAALVSSRRMALLIGLAVFPFSFYLTVYGMPAFTNAAVLVDPIYAGGLLTFPNSGAATAEILGSILVRFVVYSGLILAVWAFVWGWMKLREGK